MYILSPINYWQTLPFFFVFVQCQVDVNGPNTTSVYKLLKSSAGGFLGDAMWRISAATGEELCCNSWFS
jgi:hypothetical protein